VQPVEWLRTDEGWLVSLRCPDCESEYDLDLGQEEVSQFSLDLESGFQCLLEALEVMDHEAFRVQCRRFIGAIRAGQVFPMDF
jgi:hypothetical protein